MAKTAKLGLYCRGERIVIGSIEPARGERLTKEQVLTTFVPVDTIYGLLDPTGRPVKAKDKKTNLVKDGMQLVCPMCSSPILMVDSTDDGYDVTKGVYLVPGAVRIAS